MDGILNYFGNRLTNAVFWGLNDVVGSIKLLLGGLGMMSILGVGVFALWGV
jgi:hypothetical protein